MCNSCATYIEHRELWLVVVHPGQAEPLLLAEAEDVLPLDLLVPAGRGGGAALVTSALQTHLGRGVGVAQVGQIVVVAPAGDEVIDADLLQQREQLRLHLRRPLALGQLERVLCTIFFEAPVVKPKRVAALTVT